MVELRRVGGDIAGLPGPMLVPADEIATYQAIYLTLHLGETMMGPIYGNRPALEVKLTNGDSIYAADCAPNRILLDINKLED